MAKRKTEKMVNSKGYEPIKRRDGGYSYRVQVTISGQTERKVLPSFKLAKEWKERMIAMRNEMKVTGTTFSDSMTFNDLCEKFMATRTGTKESTRKSYMSTITKHLAPRFGKLQLREIKKIHSMQLQGDLEEDKHSYGGINKIIQLFSSIFDYAVKAEIVAKNPVRGLKKMKVDKLDYQYWTGDQITTFLKRNESNFYYSLFKFALNTGLRRGEICGLQWRNVFREDGVVRLSFNEQLTPDMKRTLVKGHSMRTIPLAPGAAKVLDSLGDGADDEYIFKSRTGKPVQPDTISREWKKAQREAGFKKLIKFHAARHSFGTYLGSKDIGIRKIQELMGHKDSKITERYLHVSSKDKQDAVKDIDF